MNKTGLLPGPANFAIIKSRQEMCLIFLDFKLSFERLCHFICYDAKLQQRNTLRPNSDAGCHSVTEPRFVTDNQLSSILNAHIRYTKTAKQPFEAVLKNAEKAPFNLIFFIHLGLFNYLK